MPTIGRTPSDAIPPGGTASQALVKTGSGSSDLGWASGGSGGGAGPFYVSSTWFDNRYLPYNAAFQSLSINKGYVKYFPFFLPAAVTINSLGVYCRTATAGSKLNIAIQSMTDDVKPGAILTSTNFNAPVNNTAQTATVADVALPAGWVWFSAGCSHISAASYTLANASVSAFRPLLPTTIAGGVTASNYADINGGSGVPTFPLPSSISFEYLSETPVLWFRIA